MIYLLSDTHFYHKLVASYREPNFEFELLQNIFNIVSKEDTIFHLGDFTWDFEDPKGILATWREIYTRKILVMGNHDKTFLKKLQNPGLLENYFDEIIDFYSSLDYKGYRFLLTHYPASDPYRKKYREIEERVRELFFEGNYDLLIHGHIHLANENRRCRCFEDYKIPCFNVNVEYINFKPISIDEIMERTGLK